MRIEHFVHSDYHMYIVDNYINIIVSIHRNLHNFSFKKKKKKIANQVWKIKVQRGLNIPLSLIEDLYVQITHISYDTSHKLLQMHRKSPVSKVG